MSRLLTARRALAAALLSLSAALAIAQVPLDSQLTYQGRLRIGGSLPNVLTTIRFRLYDAPAAGVLLGENILGVTPTNGLFTATLDFGFPPFTATLDERYLELAVFDGVAFNVVTPRQPLTAAPFALNAANATSATTAGNASTLDGLDSTLFLRSNVNDAYTAGTLTFNAGTTLDVNGTFQAPSMTDGDNAAFFVDPSSATISANLAGSITMQPGEGISVNNGTFTIGGANIVINLGDSSADQVFVPAGEFYMRTSEGTSNIFFFEDGLATGESIAWSDLSDAFTISDDVNVAGALTVTGNINANGDIVVPDGAQVNIATLGDWTFAGANIIIRAGDSSADQLVVPAKDLFMSDTTTVIDGDQTLFFTDAAVTTNNFLRWDDSRVIACADNIGNIDSAFDWHIEDNVNAAWLFSSSGADVEVTIDETGNMNIDGTLTASNGCDLAEAFLGPAGLTPGTIVVLNPAQPEGVIASSGAYQAGIVGVVSTIPGLLMRGATVDAHPLYEQMKLADAAGAVTDAERAVLEQIAALEAVDPADDDAARASHAAQLESLKSEIAAFEARRKPASDLKTQIEAQIDGWTRGNVNVALVGRVPVRVSGPVQPGQYLTTSSIPGVAMAMTQSGPTIGVALSAFDGNGEGSVVVLVQPGWFGGASEARSASVDAVRAENADLRARLEALEKAVAAMADSR